MDKITQAERKLAGLCIRCGLSKPHLRTFIKFGDLTTSTEKMPICVDCYLRDHKVNLEAIQTWTK